MSDSTNPLHNLIALLTETYRAFAMCHRAQTEVEWRAALNAWRERMRQFWGIYHAPTEAGQELAGPAIAWCRQKGGGESEFTTVDVGTRYLLMLVKTPNPWGNPAIYSTAGDDPAEAWDKHDRLLHAAMAVQLQLRNLASRLGDHWYSDCLLPWETSPSGTLIEPNNILEKRRKKKRRGAPQTHNPEEDAKLVAHWQAAKGQGTSRQEFCRSRRITVKDLVQAQDRMRYHKGVGAE